MIEPGRPQRVLGRYLLHEEIAAGGMATIHLGRLVGEVGFARTVAIKRLHPQYAKDPDFAAMFQDEAKLASRIQHPNVVAMLDIVADAKELFLVMDYVHGEPLSRLRRASAKQGRMIPPTVAAAVIVQALHGLHAAHEARGTDGTPLGIVHRDVSPQNVLVGVDGTTRITDFGIAKALGRAHTTRDGSVKGKLAYMAPEQLAGSVDRRTDVFAASIILWEILVGQSLFGADSEGQVIQNLTAKEVPPPASLVPGLAPSLDAVVMKGLRRAPEERFQTAREMAMALEMAMPLATATQVGAWVESLEGETLAKRAGWVRELESSAFAVGTKPPTATRDPNEPGTLANAVTSPDRAATRRPSWLGIGAAALLAIGVGAGIAVVSRATGPTAASPPTASEPEREVVADPAPTVATTPERSVDVAPVATASATPSAPSAAVTPATAPPTVPPPPTAKPITPTTTPPKPTSSPPPGCNPPYTLGPDGKKTWKKECF